jgi:hypothetical protein
MRRDSLDVFTLSPFVRIPFRLAFVSVRSRPVTYLSLPDFYVNVTALDQLGTAPTSLQTDSAQHWEFARSSMAELSLTVEIS